MKRENILSVMALMLLALLPTLGQAQVPEDYPYGPMLKEGYTWHYFYDWNTWGNQRELNEYTLSFKGKSMVDGHECVNCYINGNYDAAPDAQMFVDEDNRIWAYLSYQSSPWMYMLHDWFEMPLLIFDPNDMEGLVNSWKSNYWTRYYYNSCDEIEVEGKIVKRHILNDGEYIGYCVEGIGFDKKVGDFACPIDVGITGFYPHAIGLDRVTNPNGEIIYKGTQFHETGDLNEDGIVDVDDLDKELEVIINGMDEIEPILRWADLNGDGSIDVTDLDILVDIILGNNNQL